MEELGDNTQLTTDIRKIWLVIRLRNSLAGSVFSLLIEQPEPEQMIEALTAVRNK